jgi:hypothetical protein
LKFEMKLSGLNLFKTNLKTNQIKPRLNQL